MRDIRKHTVNLPSIELSYSPLLASCVTSCGAPCDASPTRRRSKVDDTATVSVDSTPTQRVVAITVVAVSIVLPAVHLRLVKGVNRASDCRHITLSISASKILELPIRRRSALKGPCCPIIGIGRARKAEGEVASEHVALVVTWGFSISVLLVGDTSTSRNLVWIWDDPLLHLNFASAAFFPDL